MLHTLWNIVLLAVAVFLVAQILPGIQVRNFATALIVAVVYSVIYFLLFWVLTILALPFVLLTFGLFVFVINAFLLWLTSQLVADFKVQGVVTTLVASLLITLCSMLLRAVF